MKTIRVMKNGAVVVKFFFEPKSQRIVFTFDYDSDVNMYISSIDGSAIAKVPGITDYDVIIGERIMPSYIIKECARVYDSEDECDIRALNEIQFYFEIQEAETPDDVANAVVTLYGIQIL